MKTLVIQPDGSREVKEHTAKLTLEEAQALVGGYVQLTKCVYQGKEHQMLVDEDGGPKRLPRNLEASRMFLGIGDIVGPVIIPLDWKF